MGEADHNPPQHERRRSDQIYLAARQFLETLGKHAATHGVVITLEPCGCLTVVTSVREPELSRILMSAATLDRDESEAVN